MHIENAVYKYHYHYHNINFSLFASFFFINVSVELELKLMLSHVSMILPLLSTQNGCFLLLNLDDSETILFALPRIIYTLV